MSNDSIESILDIVKTGSKQSNVIKANSELTSSEEIVPKISADEIDLTNMSCAVGCSLTNEMRRAGLKKAIGRKLDEVEVSPEVEKQMKEFRRAWLEASSK